MRLAFLDRKEETRRLKRAFADRDGSFCCLYGRRRCGKSRLLQESLAQNRFVYYAADESEASLQIASLAKCIAKILPGFDTVTYPDWVTVFDRWLKDAPKGTVLAIDEFPYLVNSSPAIESIFQKTVDGAAGKGLHFAICGSSQRMMQGLVLDASAPLYGRAREILRVDPIGVGWISDALHLKTPQDALDAFSAWGGVPRYWELAAGFQTLEAAILDLVLDPSGVLHNEPRRLLLDDMRDPAQASSVMTVIGQGCHRLSEIAGRLGKPATSLSRPLQRLIELGFVKREYPFGLSEKDTKRTLYRIADPFLLFWFRFVQPNRSRLESGEVIHVQKEIVDAYSQHVGEIWEDLARIAVPRLKIGGCEWSLARRWWGNDSEGKPMECDVVAKSVDGKSLLVGEVKLDATPGQIESIAQVLTQKAARLPLAEPAIRLIPTVFTGGRKAPVRKGCCVSLDDVLQALR